MRGPFGLLDLGLINFNMVEVGEGGGHCARLCHFVTAVRRSKEAQSVSVKYWEIITDNLKKAGWSLGLYLSC
jgi:hypothetical protein